MKLLKICLFFFLSISCKEKKHGLELEILNNEFYSCKYEIGDVIKDDDIFQKKSLNIIKFKLTNFDDVSYYFNQSPDSDLIGMEPALYIGKAGVLFEDEKQNYAMVSYTTDVVTDLREEKEYAKRMGYSNKYEVLFDNKNFVIHPNETLFFEEYFYLPLGFDSQEGSVNLDENKKYNSSIFICGDPKDLNELVSESELQTIKKNNYKVFEGIITSKNKVPVKFIKCN